ncbi:NAD(P)-dependent oxidoreductase, partial [Candidatus Saccharibacteria bacterium]|nr:NAD(P)-dependent oxidoreductase [Candidatus Saccharibacteria bacterium]
MKLLVTGSSGFVGRRFLEMIPADWEVVCLGRSQPVNLTERWIQCDLSDQKSIESATKQVGSETFDSIVHLAAFVPKTAADDTLDNAKLGNIDATINLLTYFGEKSEKIIIGSTAEVYDQSKIHGPITEDNVVAGGSYYGSTKLASELIAQSYAKKLNKELTILRFSVMYGGYDPIARAIPNFIRAAKAGEDLTIRGANVLRDYVHTDDVARSIICAVNVNGAGVVNIGTGRGISIRETAQAIVDSTQSTSRITV